MTYLNHAINDSPTIHGKAGMPLVHPAMTAVKFANGKFVLPDPGEPAIGIVLASAADFIAPDAEMDVQIKDICYWIAGGLVHAGSELTTDAMGMAVVAIAGTFIMAVALEDGDVGQPVLVQIVKAGYKSAGVITPVTLADCADVNITQNQLADGQALIYDATAQKWVNGNQNLANLADVAIDAQTLADGQVITYDAATQKYGNEDIPAIGLNDLTDVELTAPINDDDVIAYDTTAAKFINQAQT